MGFCVEYRSLVISLGPRCFSVFTLCIPIAGFDLSI